MLAILSYELAVDNFNIVHDLLKIEDTLMKSSQTKKKYNQFDNYWSSDIASSTRIFTPPHQPTTHTTKVRHGTFLILFNYVESQILTKGTWPKGESLC